MLPISKDGTQSSNQSWSKRKKIRYLGASIWGIIKNSFRNGKKNLDLQTSSTYIQTRQQNQFIGRTRSRHMFRAWEALKKWATEAIQSPVEIMMDKDEVHLGKKICKLSLTNYIINFCHWSIGKQTTRVRIHHDQNPKLC